MSSSEYLVYLWIDPASESSFASLFYHTTICVIFDDDTKFLFSYNENGLTCFPAVSYFILEGFLTKVGSEINVKTFIQTAQSSPDKEILLGITDKTLPEVIECAKTLERTRFK